MKVVMIGAGYVGLTTGTCLAELGHDVTCVDIDERRVELLKHGWYPIYEPGLEDMAKRNIAEGRLQFSSDPAAASRGADAVFLAVGTPSRPDGDIDLTFIEAAARQIAKSVPPGVVIVVKSTVVVGTCRWLREVIAEERSNLDFSVASNPEFLREGSALSDFLNPDRVVIGADDRRAAALLEEIYRPLSARGVPLVITNTANAELIKYAANAFLALKIGFVNDIANLCEKAGGDVQKVAEGIGLDRRVGASFLSPGPGFGGSCFPKDTRAFASTGRKHGAPQHLIETLIEENEKRKRDIAARVLRELPRGVQKPVVAVFGLAFKANTDDVREAASLTVIPILRDAGVTVRGHDPKAIFHASQQVAGAAWCECPYEAARDADLVVILTEWDEYRSLDLARLAGSMRGRTILDFRNLLGPKEVERHGLRYQGLGRAPLPEAGLAAPARPARIAEAMKRKPRTGSGGPAVAAAPLESDPRA
jgi:UDPglucose 6-dehydrogenase